MPKFEAHITLPREAAAAVQEVAAQTGWKFSAIDGDAVMGKQAYCYLTAYDADVQTLRNRMDAVTAVLVHRAECIIALRFKIERILYDTKTGVDELVDPLLVAVTKFIECVDKVEMQDDVDSIADTDTAFTAMKAAVGK